MHQNASTAHALACATAVVLALIICVAATGARAGWLKDRANDVKKVAKQIPKIANPIQPHIDIITGKKDPIEAFTDQIKEQGKTLVAVTELARNTSNDVDKVAVRAGEAVGGDVGKVIVEIATGPNRIAKEFGFTASQQAGQILQGQDPLVSLALPLAAALRDAESKYRPSAKEIPDDLKLVLGKVVPVHILEKARYAVGDVKITLPDLINKGQQLFGNDHAVVAGSVIIFSREPALEGLEDIHWWAHELYHVFQYDAWGIDVFAYRYLRNHGAIEAEADHAASYVANFVAQLNGGPVYVPEKQVHGTLDYKPRRVKTALGETTVYELVHAAPPPQVQITDRCAFTGGEALAINAAHQVVSLSRGGVVVGQKQNPMHPACVFDIQSTVSPARFCVAYDGLIYAGHPLPIGQCRACSPGTC